MKKLRLWAFLFSPSIFQVKIRKVGASIDLSEATSLNHSVYYFDHVKEILNSRKALHILMGFARRYGYELDHSGETVVQGLELMILCFVFDALYEEQGSLMLQLSWSI